MYQDAIDYPSTRSWLEAEFNRRRAQNERYSLRMFARKLDVPSGRLSELMSGRRVMTTRLANQIATRLLLPPKEREKFISLASKGNPGEVGALNKSDVSGEDYKQISADSFQALADWHHFAILSLMNLDEFNLLANGSNGMNWIAGRLGISPVQVRSALERLERLNLISKSRGKWKRDVGSITTTHDLESVALRLSHRQSLDQAKEALDDVDVAMRDITSMTMAIDLKRLPQAKKMIQKFRRELSVYLESGGAKQEVYNINIQLVPVTKIGSVKKQDKS